MVRIKTAAVLWVPTELNMGRSRMRRSVRLIDMKEEYQKFLLIKHPNTDCSALMIPTPL